MYETTFQLSRRPFVAMPSTDHYFAAQSIENARTAIVRLIDRYEGPAMVIGPVGTGKSLLCQILADYFREQCRVALIPSGRICTRRTLLQVLLHQLGLAYQNMEEGELRLSLIDHLTSPDFCPNGTLLMIDEADSLPMALLDELRTMTNLVANGQPCIRLVLFGSSRLEEKFTHPRLESLNQRLAGRFYLEPLNRNETLEYIVTQFDECGGDSALTFSNESLEAIYRATNGVPRMINQLTDHTLILATADGKTFIDQDLVNAAWSDLQQLPAPTAMSFGPSTSTDHVIEFGELDSPEPAGIPESKSYRSAEPEDPLTVIDEMQRQLTEIDDKPESLETDSLPTDSELIISGDFSPEPSSETPVPVEDNSIHLHDALDPFSDTFEDEEVLVNRIAATTDVASSSHLDSECNINGDISEGPSDFASNSDLNEGEAEDDVVDPESRTADSTDPWDDEFDPSSDPVIPEGFHEFIVDSEATAESEDCSSDTVPLPEWEEVQSSLPEVVEINSSPQSACEFEEPNTDDLADEHLPDATDSAEVEISEAADPTTMDGEEENGQEFDDLNASANSPQEQFINDSSIPEFAIPELKEADGVIVSLPTSTFEVAQEPVGVNDLENAQSTEVTIPPPQEVPTVSSETDTQVNEAQPISVVDEKPDDGIDNEPTDIAESVTFDSVPTEEPIVVATADTDVSSTGDAESGEPPFNDSLSPIAIPQFENEQPTTPESEPEVRETSPKRFNRLFSKMQSK